MAAKDLTSVLDGADPKKVAAAIAAQPKPTTTASKIRYGHLSAPDAEDAKNDDFDIMAMAGEDDTVIESNAAEVRAQQVKDRLKVKAKVEPEADEEEADEEEEADDRAAHSPRAIALAQHFGIDPDWVSEAAPEELVREINLANEHQKAVEAQEARAKKRAEEAAKEADEDDLDLGEVDDEDDAGRPIKRKATLKDINAPTAKLLKEQHKKLKAQDAVIEEIKRDSQNRRRSEALAAADEGFAELGDGFAPIFGDKAGEEYKPTDPEMKRRMAVLNACGATPDDAPARIRAKVKAAAKDLFGSLVKAKKPDGEEEDEEAEVAPKKKPKTALEKRKGEWDGAALAKPSGVKPAKTKLTRKQAEGEVQALLDQMNGKGKNGSVPDDDSGLFDDPLPK